METVALTIMLLVMLSFIVKLSYHRSVGIVLLALLASVALPLLTEYAAGQSRTQIADWLASPGLMLDMAVLLTADVALQLAFCVLQARRLAGEHMGRAARGALLLCKWIPGLLLYPVLLAMLVELIFALPGVAFGHISAYAAAGAFLLFAGGAWGMRLLLPEADTRLELLFLTNAIIAVLGVIATVNGRTAAAGTNSIDFAALAAVVAILAAGLVAGLLADRYLTDKKLKKLK